MQRYRHRETAVIRTGTQIRRLHHNVSFGPNTFDDLGYDAIQSTPKPEPTTELKVVFQDGVAQDANGRWTEAWTERDMFSDIDGGPTAAEQQAAYIAQKTAEKDEAFITMVRQTTQQRLDDFAVTRGYNSMLSLCTYATSPNPKFSAEGQYGVEARDATWAKLYEILADVQAGTRPMPSDYAEIEAEVPELQWPV